MKIAPKRIASKSILYVMALDHEYGPHLQSRFSPLLTGVGPVEAAIMLTKALSMLLARDEKPDLIVSLGSAGSRFLAQTEIFQASSVCYRDMDARPLGFDKGVTPFLDVPAELDFPLQIAGLPSASLSTGADIVSGAAYQAIEADMVDMETYALFRACQRFDIPLIAIRGISDGAEELGGRIDDWTRYLHIIDAKLARAVDLLEAQLRAGLLESG